MAVAYLQFGEQNVERYRLMFASRLVPDAPPERQSLHDCGGLTSIWGGAQYVDNKIDKRPHLGRAV
jgi:hypothetical protein